MFIIEIIINIVPHIPQLDFMIPATRHQEIG